MGTGSELPVASSIILLLITVSAVAVIARRINLPYTVALVVAGLGIGVLGVDLGLELDATLLLQVLLPALLFEGAVNLYLPHLRANWLPIVVFALPGTLLGVGIVGAMAHLLLGLDWTLALLFGSLVSPTDPVAVLALFKELGVDRRLGIIVEGESLFNDAIGIVVFRLMLNLAAFAAAGQHVEVGAASVVSQFLVVAFGGAAVGLAGGIIMSFVTRHIDDHLVEITLSGILAYGSYFLAEQIEVSGPIAVIVAGIMLGSVGRRTGMSPTTRIGFSTFWEYAGFLVNGLVFVLVGVSLPGHHLLQNWYSIVLAFLVVVAARALIVYGGAGLFRHLLAGQRLPWAWQHVILWSGLRGALCMVLALAASTYDPTGLLLPISFGIVLHSLLLQGLTVKPLCRLVGLARTPEEVRRGEHVAGQLMATHAALEALERMRSSGLVSPDTYGDLRSQYSRQHRHLEQQLAEVHDQAPHLRRAERRDALRAAILAEKSAILDNYYAGGISKDTFEELLQDIDGRLDELDGGAGSD